MLGGMSNACSQYADRPIGICAMDGSVMRYVAPPDDLFASVLHALQPELERRPQHHPPPEAAHHLQSISVATVEDYDQGWRGHPSVADNIRL